MTVLFALLFSQLAVGGDPVPEVAPDLNNPIAAGLQGMIREGMHPRLKWGNFADVQQSLDQLYQARGYQLLWSNGGAPTSQARQLAASLLEANAKGLNNDDYDAHLHMQWMDALKSGNAADAVAFDLGFSISLMRYATNLYVGRVNPRHANFGLDIQPKKLDLPGLLNELATMERPGDRLVALEPKLKLYEHLKQALTEYSALAGSQKEEQFEFPAKFKTGDRHPQVAKLRKLMGVLGDLVVGTENASDQYDKALAEAMKKFQSRHGLLADGVIGKTTLLALNAPLDQRVKQIQLGLERLRWLPDHLVDGRYIIVNIPSFQLYGFNDGSDKPDLTMNVIVGEAINGRNTPVFHSDMTYVNFRPYWNVPYAITSKEYYPIVSQNPGYLGRNNMEIVANFAPNSPVYPATGANIQLLATGALKLRQKPGPKNALGLIKFAFPNNNNVYLHSTPSQGLFKRARRDFSHGCIRVEFPGQLAEFVLKGQDVEWPREKIEELMKGDKTKTVTLKTPIPVYIFYSTVLADENGRVMFFNDIYGHDLLLQDQLAKGFPYPA
jgi:murein L,D-transpeptidase YcbB/YkuD